MTYVCWREPVLSERRGEVEERVKETKKETLGGVVEKEGGLRGTALGVQFKNKKIILYQMYKREEGVNQEVGGVWLKI